ncbi:MAG TPA: DUF3168 domain-containing protein [Burkholderiaceae bacterium]|nr:DUF3168 domain-containing protein [Burkholderiaceae bacterium]
MSTLLEDLFTVLNPLAAGGAHPLINEMQDPVYPYIVFTRITSPYNVTLGGSTDLQNTRVQVDVFSRKMAEADAIADSIGAALDASAITHVPIDSRDSYEAAVRCYRVSRDFSIWAKN